MLEPLKHLPILFATPRQRYLYPSGGDTRVLRTESINRNNDQAPAIILELVNRTRDMRLAMTANSIVQERATGEGIRDITAKNVTKVTRFERMGERRLKGLVRKIEQTQREKGDEERELWERRDVVEERRRGKELGKCSKLTCFIKKFKDNIDKIRHIYG